MKNYMVTHTFKSKEMKAKFGETVASMKMEDIIKSMTSDKAACQMITHLGKIPLFILFFNVNYLKEYQVLLPLIAAVFIGTNLGKKVLQFIPEHIFTILFKTALTIIAIRLILINQIF